MPSKKTKRGIFLEKNLKEEYYTVAEIKQLFHVTNATLCRWRQLGMIHAVQPTIRKFLYPKSEVDRLLNKASPPPPKRKTVLYCRVSSRKHQEVLKRQSQILYDFCSSKGIVVDAVYQEVASGTSSNRKQFRKLIESVLADEIEAIYITSGDRLTRFNFDHYEWLFAKHGCRIIAINNPIDQEVSEQEAVSDLSSVLSLLSKKIDAKRRQEIKNCRDALRFSVEEK